MEQRKFQQFEDALLAPLHGHKLSELEAYIAGLLLTASAQNPTRIADIIRQVRTNLHKNVSERVVKNTIRTLRRDYKFPILARRKKPAGYWWSSSFDEMEIFVGSFRLQALDELKTVSEMVKHNHPSLLRQLSFEATN